MENQEKILHLTKEESELILIAIRQAYYQTDFIDETPIKIDQHTILFTMYLFGISNIYNKIAKMLGYETRIKEEK